MTPGPDLRVLLLSRYDRLGSSSRLRTLQYRPALAAAGIGVVASPLFAGADLRYRYATGRRPTRRAAAAFARRMLLLRRRTPRYDLVWLEKEAYPFLPAVVERLLGPRRVPVLLDYDDATFDRYARHPSRIGRALLHDKIGSLVSRADAVVAGSPYLASWMRAHGARRVEELPTVVDLSRYPVAPTERSAGAVTIGWIGTPFTAKYLGMLAEPLALISRRVPTRLLVIGADAPSIPGVAVESRPWSEETEVANLSEIAIGVMPVPDEPFERGKCGYKLIQFMALGKPVVASPVGANRTIVSHGENGFLAAEPDEWVRWITALADDGEAAARMGAAGRSTVEERYSLARTAPRLAKLMHEVAATGGQLRGARPPARRHSA